MQVVLLLLLASHDPDSCRRLEMVSDWKHAARCWKHVGTENEGRRKSLALEARYRRGLCLLVLGRRHRAERSLRWVVQHAQDASGLAADSAFLISRIASAEARALALDRLKNRPTSEGTEPER
jgi:hypothetical protein